MVGTIIIIISQLAIILETDDFKVVGQFIFMIGFGIGTGPVIWVYTTDILPACGCAIIVAVEQIPNIAIGYMKSNFIQDHSDWIYSFFLVCTVCYLLFDIFVLKETKGNSQKKIWEMYGVKEQVEEEQNLIFNTERN